MLLAGAGASCVDLGDPPVVTIGREVLTLAELRRAYAALPYRMRPPLGTREERRTFVDLLVKRRLLERYGEQLLNAGEREDVREALEQKRAEVLVQRLRMLEGGEGLVAPGEIEEAYERLRVAHHVDVLRFRSLEEARRARALAEAGADFEGIARQMSAGRAPAGQWVSWSPYPDPLADALGELAVGEISQPIEAGARVLLVRVLERRVRETSPLEEMRVSIARGLRHRKRAARVAALVQRLKERAGVRFHPGAIALLAKRTRQGILREGTTEHDPDWALPVLSAAEESVTVAQWRGAPPLTAADYRAALERTVPARRPRECPLEGGVRVACEEEIAERLLLEEALRRGVDRDWWAERALERLRRERLIEVATERIETTESAEPAVLDSLVAQALENQPGVLEREARLRMIRFELPTQGAAQEELARVRRCGGALARLEEILRGDITFSGTYHITLLSPGGLGNPAIERALFEGGPGTLAGPHRLSGGWVIFGCLDLEPGRRLTREEVRAELRKTLRGQADPEALTRWLEAQRREVGVRVNEAALDALAPGV